MSTLKMDMLDKKTFNKKEGFRPHQHFLVLKKTALA